MKEVGRFPTNRGEVSQTRETEEGNPTVIFWNWKSDSTKNGGKEIQERKGCARETIKGARIRERDIRN